VVAAAAALIMLPSFWWNPFPMQRRAPGRLEAYVLDVGQGESIFMISPEGKTLLVDTGGFQTSFAEESLPAHGRQAPRFDVGEEIVCRFLWTLRVPSLDYVMVTHPQVDHAGGLPAVLENFRVADLAGPEPANRLAELLPEATAVAAEKGLAWRGLKRGDRWNLGSCSVSVLSPPDSLLGPFSRINDRSVVLKAAYGNRALLLTGDIERPVERELIRDCPDLRADILKVPHHGSATSSTEAFLDCVQPQWGLISAGSGNRFNHPSPVVQERLRARSIEFLVTSRSGALLATLSESAAQVIPLMRSDNGPSRF
jgi:competence protein ComEC